MTPERWKKVERLYHEALEREEPQRTAFLEQSCDDTSMRQEVESLLSQDKRGDGFLNSAAVKIEPTTIAEPQPTIQIGQRLGPYTILSLIGRGGMGEVYEARDAKLGRTVALKILPSAFAKQLERLSRFRREAQMASSLNHPHIVTVFDAGESDSQPYLVTEFIDGGTLKSWLNADKRSWPQIVELLAGVADALAAAHQAGILHRDVKPDNILLTRSGYAKLADFGLAKLTEAQDGKDGNVTLSAADGRTVPGMVLGTVAYMSPEQAIGKPLDARTDIFSFGVVLYEALAGRRPFAGDTSLDVLHEIIHVTQQPLPEEVPQALRDIVEKALEKDPAYRYQNMKDMVVDLRRLARRSPETPLPAPANRRVQVWLAACAIAGLLAVAGGVALWKAKLAPRPAGQIQSIAVLPLENLSRDPDQEFLSAGITAAIISNLAQIHSLDVTSRTSVMRYKQTTKPLPQIGRELGVDAIVEGSIQRAGKRVRIGVQLIRASTDKHVWANDYERDMADVLTLESDVAQAIAGEIQAKVSADETARLLTTRQVIPEAHEEYLLGLYDAWKNTPADSKQAITHFEKAIELDPQYAGPYVGLAVAWQNLGGPDSKINFRTAVQKALDIDPNSPDAHMGLGMEKEDDWDWIGADREYRRAMELNPNSVEACACYGLFLARLGRVSEALAEAGHAVKVDPLSPRAQFVYGGVLYHARRYPEAIAHLKRAIELEPRNPLAYNLLALIYESAGKAQDAVTLLDRPEFRGSAALGLAYAKAGRRDDALKILQNPKSHFDTWRVSLIYFALGDKDQGFEWLTRAFDQRHPLVPETSHNPAFDDSVRSDPRFRTLVARLNMPSEP